MSGKIFFRALAFIVLFFIIKSADAQNISLEPVNKDRCKVNFPSDKLINWFCYRIKAKETVEHLFGSYLEDILRFNRIDRVHVWPGKYLKVPVNFDDVSNFTPLPQRLEQARNFHYYIFLNISEQFAGAYEFGELKFSFPIASGERNSTPKGLFKILGRDKEHRSSLYTIKPGTPYPMFWGIKFHVSKKGVAFWIHSRDLPGYPVSHGCVGIYDEEMQKKFYGFPQDPKLLDAKKLFLWLFPDGESDSGAREYHKGLPGALIEIR